MSGFFGTPMLVADGAAGAGDGKIGAQPAVAGMEVDGDAPDGSGRDGRVEDEADRGRALRGGRQGDVREDAAVDRAGKIEREDERGGSGPLGGGGRGGLRDGGVPHGGRGGEGKHGGECGTWRRVFHGLAFAGFALASKAGKARLFPDVWICP